MQFDDIDFLIIGAGKSATTWLQMQLQSHPSVYMPDPELHYFSREYGKGSDWYLSQFEGEKNGRLVGEKSNSYLYSPHAAERIHSALPRIKLIAQLRDPVERAYSHYCMLYRRGEIGADIERFLDPSKVDDPRLLGAGNYASHLKTFVDLFGRESLLVLFFEGVRQDPANQVARLQEHLGLSSRPVAEVKSERFKDKNAAMIPPTLRRSLQWTKPLVRPLRGNRVFEAVRGSVAKELVYPPLSHELRDRMNDYYRPSIESLETLSGQSLSHWLRAAETCG